MKKKKIDTADVVIPPVDTTKWDVMYIIKDYEKEPRIICKPITPTDATPTSTTGKKIKADTFTVTYDKKTKKILRRL